MRRCDREAMNDETDRFSVLLHRVLERARKALEVLPVASTEVDSGIAMLKALCSGNGKIVVSSLAGVMRTLGKQSLAGRVLMSVMDDEEKDELEVLSREAAKRAKNGNRLDTTQGETDGNFDRVSAFVDELRQIGVPKRLLGDVQVRTARFLASALSETPSVSHKAGKMTIEMEPNVVMAKETPKLKTEKTKVAPAASNHGRKTETNSARSTRLKRKCNKRDRDEFDGANVKDTARRGGGAKNPKVVKESEADLELAVLQRRLREAEEEFDEVRRIMVNPGPIVLEGTASFQNVDLQAITTQVRDGELNAQLLRLCLCDGHHQDVAPLRSLEATGVLQSWQRIATRACRIAGVFEHLRTAKRGNNSLRIEERYAQLVAATKLESAFHFSHAAKYDRLGQFLLHYPDFLYQRKFVTLADWLERIGQKGAVIDLIPRVLPLSSVFFRNVFQLHRDGFQVFACEMKEFVTDELVSYCDSMCEQHGEVIFNNASLEPGEAKRNDNRRRQLALSKLKSLEETKGLGNDDGNHLSRFEVALRLKLRQRFAGHRADSIVILLSQENCKAQLPHTDYSDTTLRAALDSGDDTKMPLACLVAFQDETAFDVWPGAIRFDRSRSFEHLRVILNSGDMLIFRGDLVHAGAATGITCRNVRIHAYLDAEGVERPKLKGGVEETHFMHRESHILRRKE
jgi:hypothetical protein